MEQQDKQHIRHYPGTWVLITNGSARVFGRIATLYPDRDITGLSEAFFVTRNTVDGKTTEKVRSAPVHAVIFAAGVVLNPCLDFFAPLRPVPRLGPDKRPIMTENGPAFAMQRDPVVTTRDFTFKPYPVHVLLGAGTTFDFLSQMVDSDQLTYYGYIEQALGKAREEDLERVGLVAPNDQELLRHGRH